VSILFLEVQIQSLTRIKEANIQAHRSELCIRLSSGCIDFESETCETLVLSVKQVRRADPQIVQGGFSYNREIVQLKGFILFQMKDERTGRLLNLFVSEVVQESAQ
jgi:hypothetical protein